jgi:addiction module HigA family antidote
VIDMSQTKMSRTKKLAPIHPGETLRTVLDDAELSANRAALLMRIPGNRLTAILKGQRGISAETALRLARFFGTSAELWLNLQTRYDLQVAEDRLAETVTREVSPLTRAS